MALSAFSTKEDVLDFLDEYAEDRKREIDSRRLGPGHGLIKSYSLETIPGHAERDVPGLFRHAQWNPEPIGDDGFYQLTDASGLVGFLEVVSNRHMVIYSTRETTEADSAVNRLVNRSTALDLVWLAGSYFEALWHLVILPEMGHRLVTFKFEHLAQFEEPAYTAEGDEESDDFPAVTTEPLSPLSDDALERRASLLAITERAGRIEAFLPNLQKYHAPFKAYRMLRMPAVQERGGYDIWAWGKATHRAASFRGGREQVVSITRSYQRATEAIERLAWLSLTPSEVSSPEGRVSLTGAPITVKFDSPLSPATLQGFVRTTFEEGRGPFRLWGNPIWHGSQKVHVYGIDMHLWKRLYLEITLDQMVVILPHGTCGNTVHRLIANVQRFLSPGVSVSVASQPYKRLIDDAFLGNKTD